MDYSNFLRLTFLTFIAASSIQSQKEQNQFPLCNTCTCHYINASNQADVTCDKKSSQYNILQDDFWMNAATNRSYSYNSVSVQDSQLVNLTYVFPNSSLTYLNLANNDINSIVDSVFRNLQSMKTLILSYNDLQIMHPDAFKGLYREERLLPLNSLRELRLDHNKLHTLHQDLFEHTIDIEILDLSYNPLAVIDHGTMLAICGLSYLKELRLQYTEIATLPDNMMHTPKYLEILDLSGNPIRTIPETLAQAHSLAELYLNNTSFVNLTEENGFPAIATLKVLHLSRNQYLCHLHKHSLSGLENLEELRLSNNIGLIGVDSKALAKPMNNSGGAVWPPVKKLYLENNKLAYLDSDIVARWDGLTDLDVRGNPWTCECENQWLIDDLMPIYLKIDEKQAKQVMCAAPIEMDRFSFYELYTKKSQMRCLDLYGARPENDARMLVAVLAGVLIAIPSILLLIYLYQRRWFSVCDMCDNSPAAYSRRFYKASATDDGF